MSHPKSLLLMRQEPAKAFHHSTAGREVEIHQGQARAKKLTIKDKEKDNQDPGLGKRYLHISDFLLKN